MTPVEIDAWPRDVVNLFLNGCRGRSARNALRVSTRPAWLHFFWSWPRVARLFVVLLLP